MFINYKKALFLFLLLPLVSFAAPKDFCDGYKNTAVTQYWMMKENPSYECYPDPEYMPMWSPDPQVHYNWCTHKAISTYTAGREIQRREQILIEQCRYNFSAPEKPFVYPERNADPKKSIFEKREPASGWSLVHRRR